jgi:ribonuclease PH
MKRKDGRKADEIRKIKIVRDFLKHPAGSVWIEMGDTKLICSATVDDYVPFHRRGSGGGWVTAEYAMMPGATGQRSMRENHGRTRGRTHEIQRLIGRSLRSVVDLDKLGERTLIIDADVVQADGGTRTAAITGSFIALYDALLKLKKDGKIKSIPTSQFLAAVSVGVVGDSIVLDLPYSEDVEAKVDMNVVMTESGRFVEVQGTAEGIPFSKKQLDSMLELAEKGIRELISAQKKALGVK